MFLTLHKHTGTKVTQGHSRRSFVVAVWFQRSQSFMMESGVLQCWRRRGNYLAVAGRCRKKCLRKKMSPERMSSEKMSPKKTAPDKMPQKWRLQVTSRKKWPQVKKRKKKFPKVLAHVPQHDHRILAGSVVMIYFVIEGKKRCNVKHRHAIKRIICPFAKVGTGSPSPQRSVGKYLKYIVKYYLKYISCTLVEVHSWCMYLYFT